MNDGPWSCGYVSACLSYSCRSLCQCLELWYFISLFVATSIDRVWWVRAGSTPACIIPPGRHWAPHRMLSSDLTTPVSACKLSLDSDMDVLTALWLSPRIPWKFYRTLPIRLCMSLSISFFIGGDWYRNMLQQCTTCLLGASWPEFPVTIQMEMSRSWAVSEQLQLVWELRTDNSHWRPLLPSAVIPPGSEPAPSKIFQHRFSIFN